MEFDEVEDPHEMVSGDESLSVSSTVDTASCANFFLLRNVVSVAIIFLPFPKGFPRIESVTTVFPLFDFFVLQSPLPLSMLIQLLIPSMHLPLLNQLQLL